MEGAQAVLIDDDDLARAHVAHELRAHGVQRAALAGQHVALAQAAQAQREVTDMTNALLRKNAEVLKTAAVESARESERGIVDMETLQNTNASLISTLDEVMQIQTEGRAKRQAAEVELRKMEDELKQKLLEIR